MECETHMQLFMQGGKKNVMDEGILSFVRDNGISMEESHQSEKVAEIPFDFERRMVSVILKSASLKQPILITKVLHALPDSTTPLRQAVSTCYTE